MVAQGGRQRLMGDLCGQPGQQQAAGIAVKNVMYPPALGYGVGGFLSRRVRSRKAVALLWYRFLTFPHVG